MKVLKAKIKKTSPHFNLGLNHAGKSVWLDITGFRTGGQHNFKIKAVKGFDNGFAQYEEIWVKPEEISLKQFEASQLSLEIYSAEELEANKNNPKSFNKFKFEIATVNEKQYVYAPSIEVAKQLANQMGLNSFTIHPVPKTVKTR
ncbi:MAG: hypothetical protein HC896_02535 [Bacteroidales bacterium]|nr:hypothetical protein [Bacteroidales bacterium]